MPEERKNIARYATLLVVLGALARFPSMIVLRRVPIIVYFDASYLDTAQDILRLHFRALGDRAPVYPLLVAFCGLHTHLLWFAQSVLGIAASLMIFDMVLRRTHNSLYSLLAGLICSLTPEVLTYESSLMTESLTNFLLVTSLWLISRYEAEGESRIRYPLAVGIIAALASLTRPLLICTAPVYFCYFVPVWPPGKILRREALKRALSFALPAVVLIGGWCGFNYLNAGYFSPTTRAGGNLMDQVDPYVELAPQRFAMLRDTWLESRRLTRGNVNESATLVFGAAVAELEKRTGKTEIQISRELASLAFYLQIHHPLLCLRRAEQSWMQFWAEPTLDELEWPQGNQVTWGELLMTLVNFLIREAEAAFLIVALLSFPCGLLRRKVFTKLENLIFALALWVSIFAAFTEYGENRRFCAPFYMLIVYTLMVRFWLWTTGGNDSSGTRPSLASDPTAKL